MIKWLRIVPTCGPRVVQCNLKIRKLNRRKADYPDKIEAVKSYCQKLSSGGLRAVFICKGEENIPQGQKLYVGNHVSLLDPVLFLAANPEKVTFAAKSQIQKMPFIGKIASAIECGYLDRDNLRDEIKTFKQIDKLLSCNPSLSYLIYPEGTRTKNEDFSMQEFKPGAFKIATRRALPIVPVVMFLTHRILDQRYHFKKYPIQVTYLKPIFPEEYEKMTTLELSNLVQNRMSEELIKQRDRDMDLVREINGYSQKKMAKIQRKFSQKI